MYIVGVLLGSAEGDVHGRKERKSRKEGKEAMEGRNVTGRKTSQGKEDVYIYVCASWVKEGRKVVEGS